MKKILFFGEPLIRITPIDHSLLENNADSKIHFGGSEVNIARTLSGLNIQTKLLTGLPDNAVGKSMKSFLQQSNIDTSSIVTCGNRVGLYYVESGYGARASQVYYDRKNTSICDMKISDIDFEELFKDITHFHFSGITIAVSTDVQVVLEALLVEAKKRGITVSIDLNLRTKMISIPDAKRQFSKFAKYASICFGIDPLMTNKDNLEMFDRTNASIESIHQRMKELKEVFQFESIFHTMRSTDIHDINEYYCYSLSDKFYHSCSIKTNTLERIGSGDAFVAGALYKIMTESPTQEVIDFAVASGSLKCTYSGDSMIVSENQITSLLKNNNEISR